jgi:hypothetical protein
MWPRNPVTKITVAPGSSSILSLILSQSSPREADEREHERRPHDECEVEAQRAQLRDTLVLRVLPRELAPARIDVGVQEDSGDDQDSGYQGCCEKRRTAERERRAQ